MPGLSTAHLVLSSFENITFYEDLRVENLLIYSIIMNTNYAKNIVFVKLYIFELLFQSTAQF